MIISMGTGIAPPSKITGNAKTLVETLAKLVTDTEEKNHMFLQQHRDMLDQGRLYRFNVNQGLGSLGLEEHEAIGDIAEFTERYMEDSETARKLAQCVRIMKEGGQRLHYVGGDGGYPSR